MVKYAGAIYLLYIGYKMLTDKTKLNMGNLQEKGKVNYVKIYRDTVITNVLNPKVALFFISFLPQFINPNLKNTVLPFLTLGVMFITTASIWCFTLVAFSSKIFEKLKENNKLSSYINKVCGAVLIALGIKVAMAKK